MEAHRSPETPAIAQSISRKIANMSLVCAVMVVVIHTGRPLDAYSVPGWIFQLTADCLSRIAVPFFFIISGFFLAGHMGQKGWWKRECGKRLHTLLVPYLIWNVAAWLYVLIIRIGSDVIHSRLIDVSGYCHPNVMDVFGLNPMTDPALLPYWYLRALMLIVLCSPVIFFLVKRIPCITIVGLWLCACVLFPDKEGWGTFREVFLRRCFTPVGLAYFSLGVYLRLKGVSLRGRWPLMTALAVSVTMIVVKVCLRYFGLSVGFGVIEFAIPFMMYVVWRFIPTVTSALSSYSFAIFTLHIFLLFPLRPLQGWADLGPNWNPVVAVLWGVGGSVVIAMGMRRIMPRLNGIVFGGR